MATYYNSSIAETKSSGGSTDITVSGTTYAGYGNYRLKFYLAGSSTNYLIPSVDIQPQLAVEKIKDYNDGSGKVDIKVYLLLAKSEGISAGNILYVKFGTRSLASAGYTSSATGTTQRDLVSEIPISPSIGSNSWHSYTYTLSPGGAVTVTGSFNLINYSGSSFGTIYTPAVIFRSPVSTSSKMTMTFKTSRSSVSGQATWSAYSGGKVTCPSVSSTTVQESSTGSKTVYLYFNSNGGSSVSTLTGTATTRTTTTYNFTGWNNGKSAGEEADIANAEVWANWSSDSSETSVTGKASFSGFQTPTRSGYKFAGWYDSDGVKKTSISTDSNVTLYAKWYPIMTFMSGTDSVKVSKSTIENVFEGEATSWPNLYKNTYEVQGTTPITISYNTNGGTACSPTILSCTSKICYTANSNWYTTGGQDTGVSLGGYATVRSGSFTARWYQGDSTITEKAIGTLPTTTRTGYTFKEWQYEGTKVTATTKFKSSVTLNAVWVPVTYTISFNLSSSTSAITPTKIDSITKTYGTNINLPNIVPVYNDNSKLFKCWQINNYTYSANQSISDDFYVTGTTKYELVAQWSEVPHYVDFIYYNGTWKNPDRQWYDVSMITSSLSWKMNAPVWDDHSFVGWTSQLPNNFWNTYGVYESIDDIEASVTNNLIPNYVVSITDKERYLPWDNKDNIPKYYGVWVKTGKKIKVQASSGSVPTWVDIQSMYIKTDAGWKRITDTWVKTQGGWKHEI